MRMKKMKISLWIIISLCILGCAWFSVHAQYYTDSSLSFSQISEIENPLKHVFQLLQRITPLLQESQHAAPEAISLSIPHETIIGFLDESEDFDEFYRKVRIAFITSLMHSHYSDFNTKPYQQWLNAIREMSGDFKMFKDIQAKDNLDKLLESKLSLFQPDFTQIKKLNKHLEFTSIDITAEEYENLWTLFFFKNEQDLRDLWYVLVSRRSRVNTDREYRRYNIATAFSNIGNVRLIMPGEIFSISREFRYSTSLPWTLPFAMGYATFGNGARLVYGWWLCWVATAFYQGTLTNLALQVIEAKPHSTYYRNLFEAEINGIYISDPGLDATVYMSTYDVKVQNIREYPVIAVFNFDGTSWSVEQMFTLAKPEDMSTFSYIGKYVSSSWLYCYKRDIRGVTKTSCYRKIKYF